MDLTGSSFHPNKRLKEEFVSNLTGSSMLEIAALSAIVPALVVLRQWSCSGPVSGTIYAKEVEKKKDGAKSSRKDGRSYTVALVMDFLCILLPIVLIFTVLDEWVYLGTMSLILVLLFCISAKRTLAETVSCTLILSLVDHTQAYIFQFSS